MAGKLQPMSAALLIVLAVLAFSNGAAANPPRRPGSTSTGTPWRAVPSPTTPAPPPPPPSQQGDCYSPLVPLGSCFSYVTDASETTAPIQCCDGLRQVVRDNPICLCHVLFGHISRMSPLPLIRTRMYLLPLTCAVIVPPTLFPMCFVEDVPPINLSAPPAPPNPQSTTIESP